MNDRNRSQQKPPQKYWGLLAVLLFTVPQLIIPVGIIALIVYVSKQKTAAVQSGTQRTASRSQVKDITYTRPRSSSFDECPKGLFCFHKDKGEHHLSRGKEIDPWDRPDIDISKYQRRR